MQYQGGKSRLAKHIAKVIDAHRDGRDRYVEPFIGSAAVFAAVAPSFSYAVGSDVQEDLVVMWRAAIEDGWVAPWQLSEDEYQALRRDPEPTPLRAFAAYACSFAGKRWGGYARNPKSPTNEYPRRGSQSIERRASALRESAGVVQVWNVDYRDPGLDALIDEGTVVYSDPPYAGTLKYAGTGGFDHDEFWKVHQGWAERGAAVVVSEYSAPPGWVSVLDIERHTSTARDSTGHRATDRVFMWQGVRAASVIAQHHHAEDFR